jgi:hypothetical protein
MLAGGQESRASSATGGAGLGARGKGAAEALLRKDDAPAMSKIVTAYDGANRARHRQQAFGGGRGPGQRRQRFRAGVKGEGRGREGCSWRRENARIWGQHQTPNIGREHAHPVACHVCGEVVWRERTPRADICPTPKLLTMSSSSLALDPPNPVSQGTSGPLDLSAEVGMEEHPLGDRWVSADEHDSQDRDVKANGMA